MIVDIDTNVVGESSASNLLECRINKNESTFTPTNNISVNSVNDVAGKILSLDLKCRERVADSDAEEHDQSGNKLNLSAINVRVILL